MEYYSHLELTWTEKGSKVRRFGLPESDFVGNMSIQRYLPVTALFLLCTGIASCSESPPTRQQVLTRANEFYAAGKYAKAEQEYREVLRISSADPAALGQLGSLYYDQGQLLQAYPLLKQAAAPDSAEWQVRLKFALTSLFFRQFTDVRDFANRVLDEQPGLEDALVLLADTAFSPSEIDEIGRSIEARRSQDRDRSGYHVAAGILSLRKNDQTHAENEFRTALTLDPKSTSARTALGSLYWIRNDRKAAETEFKTAAEQAPMPSQAGLRYVDFLLKTGAAAEATAVLEETARKLPDYLPAQVYLMRVACAKAQDEVCTMHVQKVLARDSINYDALLQDGVINLAKGDTAKAIRELEQLSNIYPQAQPKYYLGMAYLRSASSADPANRGKAVEAAEANLAAAVKLDPQLQGAATLLAELKIGKGSPAAAIALLEPLLAAQAQGAQPYLLLGTAYLSQQNVDKALAVYKRAEELFPKDFEAPFLIGTLLVSQGQMTAARSAFERSLSISPNHLPSIERLVDLDVAARNFSAATERIQAQIDRDPKLALPWAIRGKINIAQNDLAKAEADLAKAIDLDARSEPAYQLLAQAYLASNKPEKAVETLRSLLEQKKTVTSLMMLAGIQERMKNFPAARDTYEQTLAISPNVPVALNNLAYIYSEYLGDPQKAYDLAKKARDANPIEPHTADTFGWIVFKRGQYPDALRALQESAAKLPNRAEVQFHLGSAQYMTGQDTLALASLRKATEIGEFPGKEVAMKRISVLSIDTANPSANARSTLETILREQPNDSMALHKLAELQRRDGAVDDAIKSYEKLIGANPFFAPALQRLAILYSQTSSDDPKAFDVTQKAYQAYPDDPETAKALGIQNYRRDYYARAGDLLKQSAAKRSDDAEVFYYLGAVQHQLKQWPDCKATLERATNLNLPAALAEKAKTMLAACTENAA